MAIASHALIAERTARGVWAAPLSRGHGTVRSGTGAIDDLPVTWAARIGAPNGKTSLEELSAAAHASCFSMALAFRLGEHDVAPERLDVIAAVPPGEVDGRLAVVSSALSVLSRLSAGVEITVDATLDRSRDS